VKTSDVVTFDHALRAGAGRSDSSKESRSQATLLPEYGDDYIAEDNPVRAVDAFVDELELKTLGFEVVDPAVTGLDRKPQAMTLRRRTVEHVFGTLKHWMGSTHVLMCGLAYVGTEMSLHVLAYNLKRLISSLGMARTIKAMRLLAV